MKFPFYAILFLATFFSDAVFSQQKLTSNPQQKNAFITALMKKMTLEEKIGQLNLPSSGDFTTGTATNTGIAQRIEKGEVGGLFNIKSVEKIRAVQDLPVRASVHRDAPAVGQS